MIRVDIQRWETTRETFDRLSETTSARFSAYDLQRAVTLAHLLADLHNASDLEDYTRANNALLEELVRRQGVELGK